MEYNFFEENWNSFVHTKYDFDWYYNAYFGPEGVRYNPMKKYVELSIIKSPRYFEKGNIYDNDKQKGVIKEWCCGELIGEGKSYGTYTWRISLPKGGGLWPALWLSGKYSWPPEIDLIEGYSNKKGSYIKNWFFTKIESNFHFRKNLQEGTHIALGAKAIPTIVYCILHKEIDEYKIVWTKKYVKLYFNGYCFRTMKNPLMLADMNDRALMCPRMNIMVTNEFKYNEKEKNKYSLKIYDFEYKSMK